MTVNMLLRVVSMSLIVATYTCGGAYIGEEVVGWYSSAYERSMVGPLAEGTTVWSVRNVDVGMWLLENVFVEGAIQGSHQQFWVGNNTVTYCGLLRHYLTAPQPDAPAEVLETFFLTPKSTDTHYRWCASPIAGGCSLFQWDLTIDAKSSTINIVVLLSPPAVHVNVTLYKQSSNPDAGYPTVPIADRKTCQLMASAPLYGWNNNLIPANNIPGASAGLKTKKTPSAATRDLVRRKANENASSYCYKLNNQTGLALTIDVLEGDQVAISLSAESPGYVALGFYPAWPGMISGNIVLGGPKCGVQQFVATDYVGTPMPQNWTALANPAVGTANGATTMSFTFTPPKVPNGPDFHSSGEVMWALGREVPSECSMPSYHGALRGVFIMEDFRKPNLPDYMRC